MSGVEIYKQGYRSVTSAPQLYNYRRQKLYLHFDDTLFLDDDLACTGTKVAEATLSASSRHVEIDTMEILWLESIVGLRRLKAWHCR